MKVTNNDLCALNKMIINWFESNHDFTFEKLNLHINDDLFVEGIVCFKGMKANIFAVLQFDTVGDDCIVRFKEGNLKNQFLNVKLIDMLFTLCKPSKWYEICQNEIRIHLRKFPIPVELKSITLKQDEMDIVF